MRGLHGAIVAALRRPWLVAAARCARGLTAGGGVLAGRRRPVRGACGGRSCLNSGHFSHMGSLVVRRCRIYPGIRVDQVTQCPKIDPKCRGHRPEESFLRAPPTDTPPGNGAPPAPSPSLSPRAERATATSHGRRRAATNPPCRPPAVAAPPTTRTRSRTCPRNLGFYGFQDRFAVGPGFWLTADAATRDSSEC